MTSEFRTSASNAADAVISLEMAEADETDAATAEESSADDSETAGSPEMAAAAAIEGRFVDIREWDF